MNYYFILAFLSLLVLNSEALNKRNLLKNVERVYSRSKRQAMQMFEKETVFFKQNSPEQVGGRSVGTFPLRDVTDGAPRPPQNVRIRGEVKMNSNEGRVEVFDETKQKWGLICDDYWSLSDGNITCRELGFVNAAREITRADRYGRGPLKKDIDFVRNGVKCLGGESSVLQCPHETGVCSGRSAGVSCTYNRGCPRGWTSYNGACFQVNTQKLSYSDAEQFCKEYNSKLVYVLTIHENNFLSNMLYTQFREEVSQIWTGGYYTEVVLDSGKTDKRWNWYSTIHNVNLWNLTRLWFPGFTQSSKRPRGDPRLKSCIALKKYFSDPSVKGSPKYDVNYFWWDNLSCNDKLPFICQKNIPKGRSDCYNGNGYDYRGRISRTTQGSVCAKWTDPFATVNPQSNPNVGLGNHNFCRNPDNDQMPWCWVNPSRGVYGYCAIGKCAEMTKPPVTKKPVPPAPKGFGQGGCFKLEYHCPSMIHYNRQCIPKAQVCDKNADCLDKEDEDAKFCESYLCRPNEFFCASNVFCIAKSFVCDGRQHCSDGADEKNCTNTGQSEILKNYQKFEGKILDLPDKLEYYQVTVEKCAQHCKNSFSSFKCRGFNYLPPNTDRYYPICQLLKKSQAEAPNLMKDITYPGSHYSVKENCTGKFKCPTGLCIDMSKKCNGQNDCGDNADEAGCPSIEYPPFEIRLTGSPNDYEGKVEIRYQGEWGYICDDNFGKKTADVVCNQMGFLGALEAVEVSVNRFGKVRDPNIILDELVCKGDELDILNCSHNPWRQHDCRFDELAGVVCKVDRACTDTEFRCRSDKTCIPLSKVCDGNKDCSDNTDEPEGKCKLEISLVAGPDKNSGRVELKKGYSSGTICDDGFDNNEAKVICKMLGILGRAEAVVDKRFGPGSGIVALNSLSCTGNEESLEKCTGYKWGGHSCNHAEDVGVLCGLKELPTTTKPSIVTTKSSSVEVPKKDCGNRPIVQRRSRVVGGFESIQGAFPWQVGVRQIFYDYDAHHCGGTIVSPDWVISAAHCYTRPKTEYRIRTGDWDNSVDDKYEQVFEIKELIIHPQWDPNTYDYDLALIKIERVNGEGIKFNNFVQPVCLPEPNMVPDPNTKCYVSGWGDTLSEYPEKLLAAEVPILSRKRCEGMYKGRLTNRMQCAGYEGGGIDTCQGDSGGPLICKVQGIYTIFGATSWGNGCAQPRSPGVYANIRILRNYIRQMTGM